MIDLSNKISEELKEVFEILSDTSQKLKIDFLLIGATVRDIIFEKINNIEADRKTKDIDIGIFIDNWKEFNTFKDFLIKNKNFETTRNDFSLIFKRIAIDIIPLGENITENNYLKLPPGYDFILNTSGFEEVMENSEKIKISEKSIIKIPTIQGFILLKILSLLDSEFKRQKDVTDIYFSIINYNHTIDSKDYYEKYSEIMEEYDFDIELVSYYILGKNIKNLCTPYTFKKINDLLESSLKKPHLSKLIRMMTGISRDDQKIIEMLKIFHKGLNS